VRKTEAQHAHVASSRIRRNSGRSDGRRMAATRTWRWSWHGQPEQRSGTVSRPHQQGTEGRHVTGLDRDHRTPNRCQQGLPTPAATPLLGTTIHGHTDTHGHTRTHTDTHGHTHIHANANQTHNHEYKPIVIRSARHHVRNSSWTARTGTWDVVTAQQHRFWLHSYHRSDFGDRLSSCGPLRCALTLHRDDRGCWRGCSSRRSWESRSRQTDIILSTWKSFAGYHSDEDML
jgi:hypothetical protein